MKKANYLQTLRENLSGKISDNELKDIISDYEGFFITGMEEGKTEEQICAELGDPLVIADSMTDTEETSQVCPAPVYKRIPAIIIDIVVAGLPFIWFAPNTAIGLYFMPRVLLNMVPSLLSTVNGSSHQWIAQLQPFWTIAIIASVLWFLLINPVCMIVFKGYTLGKRIMDIRVVSNDGADASAIQIFVRELFGKYVINALGSLLPSILAILPSFVSLIWASIPEKQNTLHDIIARTRVVDSKMQREEKR